MMKSPITLTKVKYKRKFPLKMEGKALCSACVFEAKQEVIKKNSMALVESIGPCHKSIFRTIDRLTIDQFQL